MTSDLDTSSGEGTGGRAAHAVLIEILRDDHTLLDHRVADLADELDTLAGTFDRLEKTLRAARTDHGTTTPDTPEHDAAASETDTHAKDSTKDTAGDKDGNRDRDEDGSAGGGRAAGPDMRVLLPWVRSTIAEQCERKLPQGQGRIRWCRSWWRHREALARFAALYRAWVEATDPETGTGTALVAYYEHLDHTLEVLMSEHGPFSACPGGRHRTPGAGDPTVGYLGQDHHPDEPDPTETDDEADDKEPQR